MTFRSSLQLVVLAGFAAGACGAQTPTISALGPSTAAAGSGGFSMIVTGANFQNGSVVTWSGGALSTTFGSATQLAAAVPANLTLVAGLFQVTVVNPGGARSNSLSFTVTAPTLSITTNSLAAGTAGTAYSQTLSATGGVPPYTWGALSPLPAGLTLAADGTLAGTPLVSGSPSFTIRVTDARQVSATQLLTLTIAAQPLSITTSSPLARGTQGQRYSTSFAAAGGTAPYSFSVGQGLPPGLVFDPETGILSGTPTAIGTYNFPVQVTDKAQGAASKNFALTIAPPPLSIATLAPLFSGTVGTPYVQTFSAAGGMPPYRWSIVSGSTGDLKMDVNSGALQGTPLKAGTLSFTVQVIDNENTVVTQAFSVVVNTPSLTITTGAALPAGSVGVGYSQRFSVVGGTAPYTWSLVSGSVPGLAFDAAQATVAGTPTTPGAFSFSLQARDSRGLTATRSFTIEIAPAPLIITTGTELPGGGLGTSYSVQINATGGVLPYTWSANGLPDGLTIDASTGAITGTLNAAGPISFTIRVIDNARSTAVNLFRMNVGLPSVPPVSISGLPAVAAPAQQFALQIAIAQPYPVAISGQAILTFSPDAGGGDATIQFSGGGSTANFNIPIGATSASSAVPLAIQTGTVAGTITVSLRLQAGGLDITPSPAPAITTRIDRASPFLESARLIRNANGFSIEIAGFSTAREVTQATYTFSAASGQTLQVSQVVIPLETVFSSWFQSPTNVRYGSQFILTQPFTIQGDANAVTPQTVTFTNRVGSATVNVTQE